LGWFRTLSPVRKTYPTDLSDAQWTRLRSYLPIPKPERRLRTHSLRDVLDAIFYVLKSGCHWRLLPHDFPPWSTVYYHFRRFRSSGLWSLILKTLHAAERKRVGKDPQPTTAILDPQSVKTVEESAHPSGYDAHKGMSKGVSATCWWTLWVFHSPFRWLRPMYKIGSGRGVFWPG
jgi:putative transposase